MGASCARGAQLGAKSAQPLELVMPAWPRTGSPPTRPPALTTSRLTTSLPSRWAHSSFSGSLLPSSSHAAPASSGSLRIGNLFTPAVVPLEENRVRLFRFSNS